jgi:hypothetical protein
VVRALKRRALEVPHAAGDRPTSTDSSSTPGEDPTTRDLAAASTGEARAGGTRPGGTYPTHAPRRGRSQ